MAEAVAPVTGGTHISYATSGNSNCCWPVTCSRRSRRKSRTRPARPATSGRAREPSSGSSIATLISSAIGDPATPGVAR